MVSKHHQGQQFHQFLKIVPTTVNILCLNKVVISLDDIPPGYVTAEENNAMMVTDHSDGSKFAIPSCKVIAVVKGDISKLIVDIEYHEAEKYRIANLKPVGNYIK
jgi:hypothetical protein